MGKALLTLIAAAGALLAATPALSATPKHPHYRVVRTLKLSGEVQGDALAGPSYALNGKAVALPLPTKVLVIANGKCRSIPVPKGAKPVYWQPNTTREGRCLLYRTSAAGVDRLHGLDLSSGASKMLYRLPRAGAARGICSTDARLVALSTSGLPDSDSASATEVAYDLATGKSIGSLKDDQASALLAWNKAGDGVFRACSGRTVQVELWKPHSQQRKVIADLGQFARLNLITMSSSGDRIFYVNTGDELCVRTLADGKDKVVGIVDERAQNLMLSPTGRYMLINLHSAPLESGFQLIDLSNGKTYLEQYEADLDTFVPAGEACAWHPAQDRFLAGYTGTVNVGEIREYDARKAPLKQVASTSETLEQAVRFYRGMGFFAKDSQLSDSELGLKLSKACEQKYEAPLRPRGRPYGIDDLLALDEARVWEAEIESFYEAHENAYAEAIKALGAISRAAFNPEEVRETWSEDSDSVAVSYKCGGKDYRIESATSQSWIEIGQLLTYLNRALEGSGCRFESVSSISHVRVLVLTPDENRRLERERGWHFD